MSVVAEDADGVASVSVIYRVQGEDYWSNAELVEADGEWSVEIAADEATPPAVEYYFKATDQAALSFVSYLPADLSVEGPFTVSVLATSLGLPFFEDFEVETGENFLSDLGWGSDAQGFPGYVWGLSGTRATSGEVSAYHARGVEDISAMEDWLISPALDLSGQDRVQVTWREYGAYVEDASSFRYTIVSSVRLPGSMAAHSLRRRYSETSSYSACSSGSGVKSSTTERRFVYRTYSRTWRRSVR